MWITQKLTADTGVKLRSGLVESEGAFAVQAESKYDKPDQLFPYGFSSAAATGTQAVMLDGYCAGLANPPDGKLQPGEVRIYNSGGAEIYMRRDGWIFLNDQAIPPKGVG